MFNDSNEGGQTSRAKTILGYVQTCPLCGSLREMFNKDTYRQILSAILKVYQKYGLRMYFGFGESRICQFSGMDW